MFKIGIGQDSHRFSENLKPLILGGVFIPEHIGVDANSDGDIILHSLCNALSSAIGGDSIGTWFDEMVRRGITDSQEALKVIYDKLKPHYKLNHISIAIEAKTPYIKLELAKKIKENIARLLEVDTNQVGLTFTSGEGLTPFGQGLGLQVISTVILTDDNN